MRSASAHRCAQGDRRGRVKTDAVGARTLALLRRADLLPESCITPREIRDPRELLRTGSSSHSYGPR